MTAVATPKLVAYVSLAAAALFSGFLLGRIELLLLATPLLTAVAVGLAASRTVITDVRLHIDTDRCLEGDELELPITLTSDSVCEVDLVLASPRGFSAERRHFGAIAISPGRPRELNVKLRATRWGSHAVGVVALRIRGRGGFVSAERIHDRSKVIKVYPAIDRIRKHIEPPQTQVFAGNYVSRASGDGIEFSAVRPYGPGDIRRRVNWRVTSRRGELHVNEFHLERNADVVLFLDTFADVGTAENTSLDLAVRGAATLARHFLLRKDRVGLVAFGGLLGWLSANTGQPHLYRIIDYLIGVEATLSYANKNIEYLPKRSLPQLALVVAFSPMVDDRAMHAFIDLHARGFGLLMIDTLPEDAIEAGPTAEDRLAFRAWKMERAARRSELENLGIPVIAWSGRVGLETVAAQLPALRRMPKARRA